jgi:uncharacterized protein
MNKVFADAHFWIAIANPDDGDHDRVKAAIAGLGKVIVHTSDEVLAEFLTYMAGSGKWLRAEAARIVSEALDAADVQVWEQSRESFLDALALYTARGDKQYSLVDCSSMNLMRRHGITEVLTRDRHFEQEGFSILIRE